jgi:SSS family solute:Na+ symporter
MSDMMIGALTFAGFLLAVVIVSLYAGRREKSGTDYFLAGRTLTWGLIGFSLIASNISTEHFVGMAGKGFGVAGVDKGFSPTGLAIASYEWMSAIVLVFVAWWFLPKFLKAGIYTMPQYLEHRYDSGARAIMATLMMVAYVLVFLATVVYSGAKALNTIFDLPAVFQAHLNMTADQGYTWSMVASIWLIGLIAASYTIYGGLKSVVWSDLLQGGGLLLGGVVIAVLALLKIGNGNVFAGWTTFAKAQADKLHTVLEWNHPTVPWLAVFVGGLWIPNIFYWGLNQFITQRTLGAKNLAEGQKGIFLAAWLKLLIPFIIVLPGIMAFHLYGPGGTGAIAAGQGDSAYAYMFKQLLPPWAWGIMLAALCGAVMSSFNSGLNSASTIFTVDLYKKYINPGASDKRVVSVGRWSTTVIVLVACLWAPMIMKLGTGVFDYIQEFWGFVTPGIVASFLVGMLVKRAPAIASKTVMLLGAPVYALFRVPGWILKSMVASKELTITEGSFLDYLHGFCTASYLHHMGITFVILAAVMLIITWRKPLTEPRAMPVSELDVSPYKYQYLIGGVTIAATAVLYYLFW